MPPQSIAILSNKGGVGKTHVCTNLALLLAQRGKQVLLIDADWSTGNVARKLGVNAAKTFQQYFRGECRISDLITRAPHHPNLYFMPGAPGDYEIANMSLEQHQRMVGALKTIVDQAQVHHVLVDLGAGIDQRTLDVALCADRQIILSTPQDVLAGYSCAKALLHRYLALLEQQPGWFAARPFKPSIIINMVMEPGAGRSVSATMRNLLLDAVRARFSERPELLARLRETEWMHRPQQPNVWGDLPIQPGIETYVDLVYLSEIPYAKDKLIKAEMERTPFTQLFPSDPASRAMNQIADTFAGIPAKPKAEGLLTGFFDRLTKPEHRPAAAAWNGAR